MVDLRQDHSYHDQFTQTQVYTMWTPNSLCLKELINKFHSASVKCSQQVPLHFPTCKGHTSGSVERCVGALTTGAVLWVWQRWGFGSSEQCPTPGRCWHSCWAPGELKGPHSGQLATGPQDDWLWPAGSVPLATSQPSNSWAFPKCRNNGAPPLRLWFR